MCWSDVSINIYLGTIIMYALRECIVFLICIPLYKETASVFGEELTFYLKLFSHHKCILKKKKFFKAFKQFLSLWMMIAKKGPLQRLSFPRGELCTFKQHSRFTAFHQAVFEYVLNFHYYLTGSAMQMQVSCFLWSSTLSLCLCQSFLGKMTAQ